MISLTSANADPTRYAVNKFCCIFNNLEFTAVGGGGLSLAFGPSIYKGIGGEVDTVKFSPIAKLTDSNSTFIAMRRKPSNRIRATLKDIS